MDITRHKKTFRIFWIIVASVVILSMLAFLLAPLF
jgi:hypothetical protein